ncbi:hypothetical protein F2P56_021682 [Juglans regia]|uniref:Uncharacterized protein n=2 Tax=Juglans regia TaxID=51240 RepID=A0A833U6C3_JUGRE|nr:uncharacterized protein LOC108981156 [Juglans regia]KAF5457592.1 hypothetical protein F2P56_021682 [Juglans regia]
MVHLRFTSFVLGLLFVMPALSESSAYAQQGEDQGYFAAKENNVAVPKGVLPRDGVNAADGLGKIWHGGRKLMAVQKVLLSEEIEREDHGLNGRTSEISGEDSNASDSSRPGGLSQDKLNAQNNMNMPRPKSSKSASLGIPRSTIKPAQFPNTNRDQQYYREYSKAVLSNKAASLGSSSRSYKTVSDHQEIYDTSLQIRDETQRLLEATKEIVNLMHKDYGKMARRKPPTNNHDPWRH